MMNRREFIQLLATAAASGAVLNSRSALAGEATGFYDLPAFGNVSLMHMTDCHAQLLPIYFREPNINIGVGAAKGQPPHLVGEHFLRYYGLRPGTKEAYALTCLDFRAAAQRYGKVGGFAHLKTLVDQVRASRPNSLLLDGGDTWQGSATALWSKAQDMVDASKLLGVDVMTAHWEFTYGADRVMDIINKDLTGHIDFIAQNVTTKDFGDPVFKPWVIKSINGVQVAIIGQAFPYVPISHPRYLVPDWQFGIQEEGLQTHVNTVRAKGAQIVVLLSHNGMDVDLKLASRVTGIDVIFGGHTHDGVPRPVPVKNASGTTLVTNAGSNGKFLGVMDFDVRNGKLQDWRYRLMPVFSNLLPADPNMTAWINTMRVPYASQLSQPLAETESLLYRRDNFIGSFDQVIMDALMKVKNAEISFSPGFRWGTSLLPGDTINMEHLMDQTAITYPATTLIEMRGDTIKSIMEDVCDNLFNPDPYLQQGGDMIRVGGMHYSINPNAASGQRISDMTLHGKPISPSKTYKVAGWAPMAEGATGAPIWDVVSEYLRDIKTVNLRHINEPKLLGVGNNPGLETHC
jgi:sulfur-oxidizing protein SoxB